MASGPSDERDDGTLRARLDELYALRFPTEQLEERAKLWRVLCASFFDRYSSPSATVLDLGAGFCDFLNHVTAGRRIAVDLNPDTARHAAPGVEVHHIPMERVALTVDPDSIDLVFASNVFEHLPNPDALLEVLDAVRRVLKPGGRLLVLQPNVRLVGGRFWDFFDHTLPLTEKGLSEALTIAGFEIEECRARFLPYTTKSRLPQWAPLVRLYLALPPAQWVLGKQMLVVARRPIEK